MYPKTPPDDYEVYLYALTDRQRQIFLDSFTKRQVKIAHSEGVTPARIGQIVATAIRKLWIAKHRVKAREQKESEIVITHGQYYADVGHAFDTKGHELDTRTKNEVKRHYNRELDPDNWRSSLAWRDVPFDRFVRDLHDDVFFPSARHGVSVQRLREVFGVDT